MAMHQMHLLQISLNIYVSDMPIALSKKRDLLRFLAIGFHLPNMASKTLNFGFYSLDMTNNFAGVYTVFNSVTCCTVSVGIN
jgi:hypothetical protein